MSAALWDYEGNRSGGFVIVDDDGLLDFADDCLLEMAGDRLLARPEPGCSTRPPPAEAALRPGRAGAAAVQPDPWLAAELAEAAGRLDGADALQILSYGVERFGSGLVLAASFQDCVLIDLATRVAPDVKVVFVDTGSHFPETWDYLRQIESHYQLNLEVLSSGVDPDEIPCGTASCCKLRKVAPLNAYLATRTAWMTGLKRVDTPERRDAPVVGWDASRGLVKVNPIATWTEGDVEAYVTERDLPRHPLNAFGYLSIGCAPTTVPVQLGEDPRAGRWAGTGKTECGLHL